MPSFPYKLHTLMETVSADEELSAIISWLPDGKSFRIHSQEEFERHVLKDFFPRQKQVKSFMRQLQYYGFENFGGGLFCHSCFRRGQRNLCGQILHQLPTKSQKVCGKSTRPLKQRGRKKKGRSHELNSSPAPTVTPYNATPSSPEPSIPDDASACSSRCSSSSHPADYQQHPGSGHQKFKLEAHVSPTCVKEVSSSLIKNTGRIIKGNVQSEQLFNQVLPLPVLPIQSSSFLSPQVLAQYEMQAIHAARSNYFSCLQNELMLGSIIHSQRRLLQQEQSQGGEEEKLPVNAQSMPSWSQASSH